MTLQNIKRTICIEKVKVGQRLSYEILSKDKKISATNIKLIG